MPVVMAAGGPARPARLIYNGHHSQLGCSDTQAISTWLSSHLICKDHAVDRCPLLNRHVARHVGDADAVQPLDGQRAGKGGQDEAALGEGLVEVVGDILGGLPVERMPAEVLADELAAGGLQLAVGVVVVRRGCAVEPRRLREGHDGVVAVGHGGLDARWLVVKVEAMSGLCLCDTAELCSS